MSNIRGLGTFTVVRGKGDPEFQVIINSIVSEEIKKLRAKELADMERERKEMEAKVTELRRKLAREMEMMELIKKNRNNLREEKCVAMNTARQKNSTRERIGFVLACFICWGEALGLFEHLNDEDFWG